MIGAQRWGGGCGRGFVMRGQIEDWHDRRILSSAPADVQFVTLKVILVVLFGTLGVIGVQI